jgi:membrane-associated two-gene conflict system component 1 (EACC1)
MVSSGPMTVVLEVSTPGADAVELDNATMSLLDELSLVDIDQLDRATKPAPAGTRAPDAQTIDTLIALVSSPIVLQGIVDVVRSWLTRRARGAVEIKIGTDSLKLSAATAEQQEDLVREFLDRRGNAGG